MSLGALGQYGSNSSSSSISDSDEEDETLNTSDHSHSPTPKVVSRTPLPPADPLGLSAGSVSTSSSDSDPEPLSPPSASIQAATPLPLPNIDKIVARNASYSASELVKNQLPSQESTNNDEVKGEVAGESSVFFNRYKKEEEAKLAVLKQHVSELDKKPEIKTKKSEDFRPGFSHHTSVPPPTSFARQRNMSSNTIPPPASYAKHSSDKQPFLKHRHMTHPPPPNDRITGSDLFDDKDSSTFAQKPRKHRSGVGDSLNPPKKFMKMHEKIQARERPWTMQ